MGNAMDKVSLQIPECESLRQAYLACSSQKLQQGTDGTLTNYDKTFSWEAKCFQEFDDYQGCVRLIMKMKVDEQRQRKMQTSNNNNNNNSNSSSSSNNNSSNSSSSSSSSKTSSE